MNTKTFNELLDELDGNSLETLKQKNARYASPDDCLHNFDAGAEIMGMTPAQCAWCYMTKHLVALRDKVQRNDFSDRADLLEKCQDTINYVRFIWLIANDIKKEPMENTFPCCTNEITIIPPEKAEKMAQGGVPLGRYIYLDGGKVCGIDNSDGEEWTKEFETLAEFLKWLDGGTDETENRFERGNVK